MTHYCGTRIPHCPASPSFSDKENGDVCIISAGLPADQVEQSLDYISTVGRAFALHHGLSCLCSVKSSMEERKVNA